MRKLSTLLFVAVLVSFMSALQPTSAQAQGARQDGWSTGKAVAVGAGVVGGIFVANATLPVAWGIAAPVLGGAVGAMLGNWGYTRATAEPSMLRRASMTEAEVPTLYQLAVFSDTQ